MTLSELQTRYQQVNGDHPMTAADDAYVREHYQVAPKPEYDDMLAGRLPLPSYLLSDGTPMVPGDRLEAREHAGGSEALPAWFAAHWPDRPDVADHEWSAYLSGQYVCLRSPSPLNIKAKRIWSEQIEAGTGRLDEAPHDVLGRSLIGEAVAALDTLLLPMCDYDRLRFGGPQTPLSRERWVDGPRTRLTTAPVELPLRTERLLLRRARPEDAAVMHRWYSDPEVARYLLHPPLSRPEVDQMVARRAGWVAPQADGDALYLHVEMDGRVVGDVMLQLLGPALVTGELGWCFDPEMGGRGIATEAAQAVIDLGLHHYRLHRIVAMLDGRNDASRKLCERLGMTRELDARADYWSKGEWTPTYRYGLLAG